MSSQTSSYCNQSVLLQQTYSSPKLDHLLPLSQPLTDNTTLPTTVSAITSSNLMKNEQIMPTVAYYSSQPPSTILSSNDSPLASVDLFTPTTNDSSSSSSHLLTAMPQSMYLNDPVPEAAAVATISTNMLYDPICPSTLSTTATTTSVDPLLTTTATTLDENAMMIPPFIYSNPSPHPSIYHDSNNNSQPRHRQASISSNSSADKAYSFVAIPGMNQRKRPRRRYDEIERLYHCTYSGCKKSYGTLNHLNSHVLMQSHGPKRHPSEFKEMRKEWRRQRKQREEQRRLAEKSNKQQQHQPTTLTAAFQPPSTYIPTNITLQPMPLTGFY